MRDTFIRIIILTLVMGVIGEARTFMKDFKDVEMDDVSKNLLLYQYNIPFLAFRLIGLIVCYCQKKGVEIRRLLIFIPNLKLEYLLKTSPAIIYTFKLKCGYQSISSSQNIKDLVESKTQVFLNIPYTINDVEVRGAKLQFVFYILAPRIIYLESLRIKDILLEISDSIKASEECDAELFRKSRFRIFTTSHVPRITI